MLPPVPSAGGMLHFGVSLGVVVPCSQCSGKGEWLEGWPLVQQPCGHHQGGPAAVPLLGKGKGTWELKPAQ